MAVKKTTPKTKAKAAPKKAVKAAPKKTTAVKAAATKKKVAAAKKVTPKKKATPVKLTDKQAALLKTISQAKEGYLGAKGEAKALESLQTKKLIKRGPKDKEKGLYRYSVSKAGEKHITSPTASK